MNRRLVLVALGAALVAVLVALVVLSRSGGEAGPVAVDGVPPTQPAAVGSCRQLLAALPDSLGSTLSRRATSGAALSAAWGSPPVVLTCGVPRSSTFEATSNVFDISGVTWYGEPDPGDPAVSVLTTPLRPVGIAVRLPEQVQGADVLAVLSPVIAAVG